MLGMSVGLREDNYACLFVLELYCPTNPTNSLLILLVVASLCCYVDGLVTIVVLQLHVSTLCKENFHG